MNDGPSPTVIVGFTTVAGNVCRSRSCQRWAAEFTGVIRRGTPGKSCRYCSRVLGSTERTQDAA